MKPQAIVTDVEGTISSIRFSRDVLQVYAEQFLPDFVRRHRNDRDVARTLRTLGERTGISPGHTEALIAQLQQWLSEERPVIELQTLVGMVWEQGYAEGQFQSHVYPDVPPQLERWRERDINLYVFGNSSEKAQRLFCRYSTLGDLRLFFAGFFDRRLGARQKPDTYRGMAESIALPPADMLYISDTERELDAAAEAGLHSLRIVRPEEFGKGPGEVQSAHARVASFEEIRLDKE